MNSLPHILIADTDISNIKTISKLLKGQGGYKVSTANDVEVAINMLQATPDDFDIIILNRVMANINNMDILAKIKQDKTLCHCPVIFQSEQTSQADIIKALEAGAHYQLTKPFEKELLFSVINTAIQERLFYKEVMHDFNSDKKIIPLIRQASFEVTTLNHARDLASLLSHAFPEPATVITGLTELIINAIEHGNLNITYDEKSALNENGNWEQEVSRRLSLAENANKTTKVNFNSTKHFIEITITDQGDGFDWQTYMDFDPKRIMDNHGRGIAVANKISFSEVIYSGNGNTVCARMKLS